MEKCFLDFSFSWWRPQWWLVISYYLQIPINLLQPMEKANYILLPARLRREEYLLCFDGSCTWPEFSVEGETGEPPSKSSIYNLTSFSPSRSPTFLLLLLLPYSETCSSTIFHHSAFKHWVGTSREWKFSTNRNVCPLFAEMCEEKPFQEVHSLPDFIV